MVALPASTRLCPGLQVSELWEVVEEPRGRLGAEGIMPERQEGHLLKKRKWPLKGWHKVEWAGPRVGPDAGAGWECGGGCWAVQGVCMSRRRRKVLVCGCSLPPPFPVGLPVLFLLGNVTEILCARGWDPSLCDNSARCESGPRLGVVGEVWPQNAWAGRRASGVRLSRV